MKIFYFEIDIIIIDLLNKCINFLNILVNEFEFLGVYFFYGCVEDFG